MSIQPKLLGYIIMPHDDSEGFASSSIEQLLVSHESHLNFPFLNYCRLEQLKRTSDIKRTTIHDIDATGFQAQTSWSPASRFLYQMTQNGRSDKLEIPSNRIIISTNRKAIIEIMKFGRPTGSKDLTLKTKLKFEKYGKVLKIACNNQASLDLFWTRRRANSLFGMKFGLFLTTDKKETTKTDATLFSIHSLEIDDALFIYEAEIDAIGYTKDKVNRKRVVSIYEIKTHCDWEEIRNAFTEYAKCSTRSNSSLGQIENSLNNLENGFAGLKVGLPFRQGELGGVHKFIYGFHDTTNQSALAPIRVEEFNCYPGTLLIRDASYLLEFVQLLDDSGILSHYNGLTWKVWDSWRLQKGEDSVKLEKDGIIIGNLRNWEHA